MEYGYAHASMPVAKYDEFDFKSAVVFTGFSSEENVRNRRSIFEVEIVTFARRHNCVGVTMP